MVVMLWVACAPEEARNERALKDWGDAWCSYRERCCPVENTDAPTDCGDELAQETCATDWLSSSEGCTVLDEDRFADCITCYETADLYNVAELDQSCLSNVAALCADACDSTLDCPETL